MIKKTKEQKGITLVALVITIIVLLILAGVTLSIVWNGGIIEKSANAVDKYENSSANETNQIEYMENMFDKFYHNATVRSSSNGGGDSGGNTESEWVIDTDYGDTGLSLGDLVKPKNLTGTNAYLANEKFYVIGIDGTGNTQTVRLLAEKCVKTDSTTETDNIQSSSANTVVFNENGNGNVYATSAIKELVDAYVSKLTAAGLTLEDVETMYGGTAVSGTKGRLMWVRNPDGDVNIVQGMTETNYGIAGTTILLNSNYWLGSPDTNGSARVYCINNTGGSLNITNPFIDTDGYYRCSPSYKSSTV